MSEIGDLVAQKKKYARRRMHGVPSVFRELILYGQKLDYADVPAYTMLMTLFKYCAEKNKITLAGTTLYHMHRLKKKRESK